MKRVWISADAERALAAFCVSEVGVPLPGGRDADGTIVIGDVAFGILSALQRPGQSLSDVMLELYHFDDPEEVLNGEMVK